MGSGGKELSWHEKRHVGYIKQVKIRERLDHFAKSFPVQFCDGSIDLRNSFDELQEPTFRIEVI